MTSELETIAQGDGSRIVLARRAVARDDREWQALWAAHAGADSQAPSVDFARYMVVGVFAGQRPAGWHVEIVSARSTDADALAVLIDERRGTPGVGGGQLSSSPYHIVALPRTGGTVRFAAAPSRSVTPVRAAAEDRRDQRSSTGLRPTTAGALAYAAGPLSGSLLLVVEETSRFVRFHAWQALVGLGTLGVAVVVCLGLAFFLLVFSSTAFWTMLWMAAALGAIWVGLWAFCVVQAYRGSQWKMPIVGNLAERRAYRK